MVDKTINDLTEDTNPSSTDYIATWDGSANASKKASIANIIGSSAVSVSSGAGAPATTPGSLGSIYIDTTNDLVYMATDTASSADWDLLVDTDATQTLSNKTLTSPNINEAVALTATATELNILDGATLSTTELNYIDGVTSAVQTQLDSKAPIADPTFTGEIGIGAVNVSETELGILEGATLTTTELNYVDGVTSAIQTQLDDKAPAELTLNAQSGTTYTLVLTDANKYVRLNNASAITLTVPPNASVAFPVGTQIVLRQVGAGQVTVAEGSGVTVNTSQTLLLRTQHSTASLIKVGTDEWDLAGDLEAV